MAVKSVRDVHFGIPLFGLIIPPICLAGLYLVSEASGFVFGNIIFGLTIVMSVLWAIVAGWGRKMRAASPLNELLFRSGSRFAQDGRPDSVDSGFSLQTQLLTVLTGIVLWGWIFLLVELVLLT